MIAQIQAALLSKKSLILANQKPALLAERKVLKNGYRTNVMSYQIHLGNILHLLCQNCYGIFFWYNRKLLQHVGNSAASCISTIAAKKNAIPGMFGALHTFKRNSERNVHFHLSTTTGGISKDHNKWINLYFPIKQLEKMWKYNIITMFRNAYKNKELIIPPSIQKTLDPCFTFNNFLDELYRQEWIIHCGKSSNNYERNVEYFGRYTKRPPIADSKIRAYDGQNVTIVYKNHRTDKYEEEKMPVFEFIRRFIQHIPDLGFRMIRYYGFLADRVRGKLLEIVYKLIDQTKKILQPVQTHFAALIYKNFGYDPLTCPVCGSQLHLSHIDFGQRLISKFSPSVKNV